MRKKSDDEAIIELLQKLTLHQKGLLISHITIKIKSDYYRIINVLKVLEENEYIIKKLCPIDKSRRSARYMHWRYFIAPKGSEFLKRYRNLLGELPSF